MKLCYNIDMKTRGLVNDMKYRVCWRNKLTGATGHGQWVVKELAEVWLKEENTHDSNHNFEYWLEETII